MPISLSGSLLITGSITTTGGITISGSILSASYSATSSFSNDFTVLGNLTVFGTQSVQYITSSQLNISDNVITVNVASPGVRFGGLSVFDSGSQSSEATASLFWDSQQNHWIYQRESGSTYDGGMLISGPRNAAGLGNESGTTACMLLVGQGGDHLTSSLVYHDSTKTCFYGTSLFISSSGNVGIGVSSPQSSLHIIKGLGSDVISIGESGTITRFAIGQEASYTGNYINSRNVDLKLQTYCSGGSGGNIHFQTGTDGTACVTTKMFLCSNGNLGIGTTTSCTRLEVSSTAASADRTLPHNVLTITAEQGNAPYFPFGGAILFKNRSYTSGLVESSRIRSVIYDDGAPANCGGGIWFETTRTPGGTLTPSLVINYAGTVGIGTTSMSTEANLFLGNQGAGAANEGGQLVLQKGTSCACATHLDNFANQFRVISGTDTSSTTLNMSVNHVTGTVYIGTTLSISTTALHGIKTFEAGPTSAYNINLPAEFPNMLLSGGNVWGIRGKGTFFNAGTAEVRDFYIARNSGGSWSSANYGPSSCTSGGILQSVAGTGTCITINMNSNSYVVVEVTAMVR